MPSPGKIPLSGFVIGAARRPMRMMSTLSHDLGGPRVVSLAAAEKHQDTF